MQFTEQQILEAARVLCNRSADNCNINKDDNWTVYGEIYIQDAKAALGAISLADAPQVVADERAHEIMNSMAVHVDDWADGLDYEPSKTEVSGKALHYILSRVAAPVQAKEPVAEVSAMPGTSGFTMAVFKADDMPLGSKVYRASVQPVAVPEATIVLSGHQLRMALDLINPGGPDERDELDDQLLFGIRQHRDDDGKVSTDMCCWNGDTDGVLPLDGEYEAPAAPAAQGDAKGLPPIVGFGRYSDSKERGLLVTFERRLDDDEVAQVRAAIAAKAAS